MRDDVHRYIVAYDISNDKIRTRVSKVLKSYGSRAQFSVFLVDLSDVKAQRMTASVEGIIDPKVDSVMICDLGAVKSLSDKRFRYLGAVIEKAEDGPLVV